MDINTIGATISHYANIIHSVKVREVGNSEDSIIMAVRYAYRDREDSFIMRLGSGDDVTDTEIEGNIKAELLIVENCIQALDRLNNEINNMSNMKISYTYSGSERTRIHSWSYDEIEIKMDRQACINLSNNIDNLDIKRYSEYYQGNLAVIVKGYNEFAVHKMLGTQLIEDVYSELRYSLLSREDAIQYIADNKDKGIEQLDIRFGLCMEDLSIVALIEWHIEYRSNICNTRVYNNRAIDMNSNLTIRDSKILDSIVEITRLRDNERYRIFNKIL